MKDSKRRYFEYEPQPRARVFARIAFVLIAVLIVVAVFAIVKGKHNTSNPDESNRVSSEKAPQEFKINQPLPTRFFNVTVTKVYVQDKIVGENQNVILPKKDSCRYIVIELTLTNKDKESQLMPDGGLHIDVGGERKNYDYAETMLRDGWGQLMENIEPGATKKTKLVYKVPLLTPGKGYYYPDILYDDDRIFLGNL